ncbi:MAG: trypsin-like peptidase domain-containing protein [Roseburia sp.]|nr:trypsin-like peptidase domain-containing protein [Anaeroplasma bactoclasticum]MCM1195538.1 trypsin-like peptidase domain-containing protein [Roseburia sp.]MCM1557791.1 trypsin-like peptidase domain-containing protein [Anaeroplasma bactoclasticum]
MKKLRNWIGLSLCIFCLCLVASCSFGENQKTPTKIEQEIVEIQNDISEIYKTISPGCVGVYATSGNKGSVGSGVVYKKVNGLYYVVTNHHVIEDMTTIRIYRGGSRYIKAQVVGSDAKNDIAVLTFSLDLFGGSEVYIHDIFNYDEEIVSIGQTVLAIGCPLGLENFNTLTTGVVSRVTKTQIQTNAEINPGNSGGGLFNVSGRLIGINTQKEVYTTSEENGMTVDIPVEGLGYAISLDVVKKCILDIEDKKGEISRPLLGLTVLAVNRYISPTDVEKYLKLLPNTLDEALIVTEVNEGVAKKAGILADDIIFKANDVEICNTSDLSAILNLLLTGDILKLEIYRPSVNQTMIFNITL